LRESSRKLFALHDVLYDVYGGSSLGTIPDYPEFVNLVNDINSLPIEPEGVKPRKFLQTAGDLCRGFNPDCFASWAINKAKKIHREAVRSLDDLEDKNVVVLISDVRYLNEARSILEQPNGFVICFDATQDVLNQRLMKRDGKLMNEDEMAHSSEKQIDYIKNIASAIINTNELDLDQQTAKTIETINKIKEGTNA
jgi:gluconate kinase